MKGLYIFVALLVVAVNAEDTCSADTISECSGIGDGKLNCNALFSGIAHHVEPLVAYANDNIQKSFDYLVLATNFGSHVKNRPGFEKQFRALSDNAWNQAIGLIKHVNKRGREHTFGVVTNETQPKPVFELNELNALAYALDSEKTLATTAHRLHRAYSHAHIEKTYDPEVAHYLEEEIIGDQASTVRKLSGYTNDLKRLISSENPALSVFLFDEYLQKQ